MCSKLLRLDLVAIKIGIIALAWWMMGKNGLVHVHLTRSAYS